jgi:hypothetical protein
MSQAPRLAAVRLSGVVPPAPTAEINPGEDGLVVLCPPSPPPAVGVADPAPRVSGLATAARVRGVGGGHGRGVSAAMDHAGAGRPTVTLEWGSITAAEAAGLRDLLARAGRHAAVLVRLDGPGSALTPCMPASDPELELVDRVAPGHEVWRVSVSAVVLV